MKWRIQRESYLPWAYLNDPAMLVWAAYPPERGRKPFLFTSWRAAITFVGSRTRRVIGGRRR